MTTTRWDVLSPRPKKDGGTFWHRVGTAWQGDKGINVTFDSLPIPDAEGRVSVSLFEPREKQSRTPPDDFVAGETPPADLDDAIPF